MSRPRSRSPRYRGFPWEESSFDPDKVTADLDGSPQDGSERYTENVEDPWDCVREDMYPEARRSPPPREERKREYQRPADHGTPSPRYDEPGHDGRRRSAPQSDGADGDRRRGGFRDQYRRFGNRGRGSPHSHFNHQQQRGTGGGWSQEQVSGHGRFRDQGPGARADYHRGTGRERGRKNPQGPHGGAGPEDPHQSKMPPFKRQRRDMEDASHHGYRNEEDFGERRFSRDSSRERGAGNAHPGVKRPRPYVHDRGVAENRNSSQWEHGGDRRGPDFSRRRSPPPILAPPTRPSENHSRDREDGRGQRFQETWRDESRRSPTSTERPNAVRYVKQNGSVDHGWRGHSHRARGHSHRGQRGHNASFRNQQRPQQAPPPGPRHHPHEAQRPGYRPFRDDNPVADKHQRTEEDWEHDRPRSLDRHLQRDNLDPKFPQAWVEKRAKTAALPEETLTIKVDMTRPVNKNSLVCYSSDRQLSLDLVNVGRQRLDFLPMLEHSGTYRETPTHTGTFAQEIITLVHHVKEHYFRGEDVTLNERFSAPPDGGHSEQELTEMTLDERFSSNRGFSLNQDSLLEEEESLFSELESVQPLRGPGDLRHDLERRRQERLEGVKVTIPGTSSSGSSTSQRHHAAVSDPGFEFSDPGSRAEDQGFCGWSEEQGAGGAQGNMTQRRGTSFRPKVGFQRGNFRPRPQNNNRNNYTEGPQW